MAKNCLIYETLNGVKELEIKKSDGLMTLSGVFGVCGVRNNNQRIYETSNYSKMVAEMRERIKNEGGIPGELEHPQLMNITLENVSHKITDINIDENGLVTGSITLLNTPKGKIAQAIVEGGLPLFISSRATGQVDKNSGNVTLERIATYDLVGSPGFSQAKLHLNENQVAESINESTVFYITEKEEPKIEENENNNIDEMELKEILEKVEALESRVAELEDMNSELQSQIDEKADFDLEKLANGIQKWIVEEYSPLVQKWIVEEFASDNNEELVEEAVEVNVVHKCNPYHCGQPGKTPFPRKTFLHHHQQQVCNQRHPYLDFDGVGAFAIKVFQRKMTQPSFLQLSSNRASSKPSINSQISIPKKWSFGQFFEIGWLKQLCHKRQIRCKLLLST